MSNEPMVVLKDITKYYRSPRSEIMSLVGRRSPDVKALDGVSLSISEGSVVAIVGESGSGKTTLGKILCRLESPSSGEVKFKGQNLYKLPHNLKHEITRQIQMVFQDPYESLDPRFTVNMTISEPLLAHGEKNPQSNQNKVNKALLSVGLSPADRYLWKKPYELSGGERQRVSIARAIILQPSLIIADEPTSMLDVSVRAGVLNLLLHLRDEIHTSIILITHDLAVARYLAESLIIFYSGRIMETGPTESIISNPKHPYTSLLLSASPRIRPGRIRQHAKENSFEASDKNCSFISRCPIAQDKCLFEKPNLVKISEDRLSACHYASTL